MGLNDLPSVVLDKVVESAGFDHGWRLECACVSLRTASQECDKTRLGKCYWAGGAEFTTPRWRHVAAAARQGRYLLRPGPPIYPNYGAEETYMEFRNINDENDADGQVTTSLSQATRFTLEPVPGGCVIHEVGSTHPCGNGRLETNDGNHAHRVPFISLWRQPGEVDELDLQTRWKMPLNSHDSHLEFRGGCSITDDGVGDDFKRVLQTRGLRPEHVTVSYWELAPAALTVGDERFAFQKSPYGEE